MIRRRCSAVKYVYSHETVGYETQKKKLLIYLSVIYETSLIIVWESWIVGNER
jgi:hypothetical protein